MKTALVTGSAGFVGRHVVQHLRSADWSVNRVDIAQTVDAHDVFDHWGDSTYDLVVHAAAASPHRRAIDTEFKNFPYNVKLDAGLFEWAIRTRQPRVVYLSSCAIYPAALQDEHGWRTTGDRGFAGDRRLYEDQAFDGEPFDTYGLTKQVGEQMAQRYAAAGGAVHILRPFSGYGEDQSINFPFAAFIQRARRREYPFTVWGNAEQVRDWIHIDDVVGAMMAIVEADLRDPVNVCTGVGTSMRELAQLIHSQVPDYAPEIATDETAPMGALYRVGDPALLNTVYVSKITLEEGVDRALRWNG